MALDVYRPGNLAIPAHARALGARVKPIIRLGLGVVIEGTRADGSTFTRPEKTDYFTVRGNERAVAKFKSIYGETPRAVKVMVPSSLALALEISYRAFVGGQNDPEGGRPLALGMTNFGPLGFVGGPDVLRVWKQDGTYAELETAGLDELGKPLDDVAAEYGIEVHTTFTFTIPDVLGWGSFAQVTSKGKESANNLVFKLGEIYSAFGAKAPWAFDRDEPPQLVLKPSTALTRLEDRETGKAKWSKTRIYVLDIVVPEAFDAMRDRLIERQRAIGDSATALYGPPALPQASPSGIAQEGYDVSGPRLPEETPGTAASEGAQQAAGDPELALGPPAVPGPDFEGEEPGTRPAFPIPSALAANSPVVLAAQAGGEALITSGQHKGKTLREVAALGDKGSGWIRWALRNWKTEPLRGSVWAYARVYEPGLYTQVRIEKEGTGGGTGEEGEAT